MPRRRRQVARNASFLISRARRLRCGAGFRAIRTRHRRLIFVLVMRRGRAAHRSAPPSVGHASDQATFKFVADSLPLFRSASRSYVTFMPSARPFIPDQPSAEKEQTLLRSTIHETTVAKKKGG